METKKEKAIALCRVSTDEQLKNHSLSRQEESVEGIANRHNLEIVKIWSGSASSKCGKNFGRKDLREMLDFCKKNKQIKYVVVDEPDRFMRSIEEGFWYIAEFRRLGVKVLFSNERLNGDDVMAKFFRSFDLFTAESSNEERARKTKAGHEKAIRDGRYPFVPPLGYMRGKIKGVHEIDPIVGPLLKAQLIRIANGLASPTIALQDYNHSVELAGLKKAPLKMDKWRLICTNPFYCGIIEVHKIVDASNPNGLHQKLITKEQHEKIVETFDGKSKNQKGPNTSGNPLYPFNQMIAHVGCPCNKSKYNTFVGVTVKNNQGKEYEKYRCRGCYMYISREEMREKIEVIVASMELTKDGEKALHESLTKVFDLEEGDFESKSIKLRSQRAAAKKEADRLFDYYLAEQPGPMKDSIKCRFEEISRRIKMYDKKIDELGNSDALELRKFCAFAISFVSNLARNILELSPAKMQLCKQLLFPDGFFVDENKNVYTPKISPLYRSKSIKNGSEEPSNSLVVRAKRL